MIDCHVRVAQSSTSCHTLTARWPSASQSTLAIATTKKPIAAASAIIGMDTEPTAAAATAKPRRSTVLEHARVADLVIDERRRAQAVTLRRVDVHAQGVLPFAREPSRRDAGAAVALGNVANLSDRRSRGLGDRALHLPRDGVDEALGDVREGKAQAHCDSLSSDRDR